MAKLSVESLARIGGYMKGEKESPLNSVARNIYNSILTQYLADMLKNDEPEELLKILNSNCMNPYLIWDNSTRAELNEFLDTRIHSKAGPDDLCTAVDFKYEAHKDELVIGGIFIRIYNEQPTFTVINPKGFAIDLLDFLNRSYQQLGNLQTQMQNQGNESDASSRAETILKDMVAALDSLKNVLQNNAGVEIQCIGHFRLFFNILSMSQVKPIQQSVLELISLTTKNQECVKDIAASEVLGHLLLALLSLTVSQMTCLEILHALLSTPKLVKEALAKGNFDKFLV